jgi:hypothetical protein
MRPRRHVVNNERIRSIKPFDVGYCRARCGRSKTARITRRIGGWHEVALYPASGTETRDDGSDRPHHRLINAHVHTRQASFDRYSISRGSDRRAIVLKQQTKDQLYAGNSTMIALTRSSTARYLVSPQIDQRAGQICHYPVNDNCSVSITRETTRTCFSTVIIRHGGSKYHGLRHTFHPTGGGTIHRGLHIS